MIKLKDFIFNSFQVNTYIIHDETGECVVIDPACYTPAEKKKLDHYIESNQLKLVKIINTHGHVDHVLGMRHVAQKYNPSIEMHADDIDLLARAEQYGTVFGFNVEEPPVITSYLSEDKEVTFGKSSLKVLHVPGHSRGSVAFYNAEARFVITGDALFRGSIGRTDLPGGDYDQLMNSIYKKLMTLPPETEVFPGHGPSTTIHDEALNNPFLV